MVNKGRRYPNWPHRVHVEHLRPGLVVDVSKSLARGSADSGTIEEQVNRLAVEFRGSCLDAREVSDIDSQDQ